VDTVVWKNKGQREAACFSTGKNKILPRNPAGERKNEGQFAAEHRRMN
jgi:hypothetical protein